jgi:hypothetical protein
MHINPNPIGYLPSSLPCDSVTIPAPAIPYQPNPCASPGPMIPVGPCVPPVQFPPRFRPATASPGRA